MSGDTRIIWQRFKSMHVKIKLVWLWPSWLTWRRQRKSKCLWRSLVVVLDSTDNREKCLWWLCLLWIFIPVSLIFIGVHVSCRSKQSKPLTLDSLVTVAGLTLDPRVPFASRCDKFWMPLQISVYHSCQVERLVSSIGHPALLLKESYEIWPCLATYAYIYLGHDCVMYEQGVIRLWTILLPELIHDSTMVRLV